MAINYEAKPSDLLLGKCHCSLLRCLALLYRDRRTWVGFTHKFRIPCSCTAIALLAKPLTRIPLDEIFTLQVNILAMSYLSMHISKFKVLPRPCIVFVPCALVTVGTSCKVVGVAQDVRAQPITFQDNSRGALRFVSPTCSAHRAAAIFLTPAHSTLPSPTRYTLRHCYGHVLMLDLDHGNYNKFYRTEK